MLASGSPCDGKDVESGSANPHKRVGIRVAPAVWKKRTRKFRRRRSTIGSSFPAQFSVMYLGESRVNRN